MQGDLRLRDKRQEPWQLQGESSLELDEDSRSGATLRPRSELKRLDLGAIRNLFSEHLADFAIKGSTDLRLHMVEQLRISSIDFQTDSLRDGIELLLLYAIQSPIRFKKLLASGRLQTTASTLD